MKMSVTLEVDLQAVPFPAPLPFPDLVEDYQLRQQAMDALSQSEAFLSVAKYVLADWIHSDGGVALAQAINGNVAPRDAHLLLAAMNQDRNLLAGQINERIVSKGSIDSLMRSILGRIQLGKIEVTNATLDRAKNHARDVPIPHREPAQS